MTNENEKAIKNLKKLKSFHNGSYGTAIDTAIKALEQTELNPSYNSVKSELKPSEDCISRTKLLSRIDAERKHLLDLKMDGAEHIIVHHARRIIEDMPSVTPQPCEDCISREAAIDVVRKWFDKIQLNSDICLDGIRSLSSVTPKAESEEENEK